MNTEYQLLIDTWEGQAEIDEDVLIANGVAGMIIRLNDMNGGHHLDSNFFNQWNQATRLVRAPYFVYNPWVSGLENYQWLANNCPQTRAVLLDIEVRKSDYSPTLYATEVKRFYDLVKARWTAPIYTGEWFLSALSSWPANAEYWWAQYPSEFYPAQTLQLTWDQLRTRLQRYDRPLNASKIPGQLRMWQFSGDRLILPGNPRIMDVNVFYGSRTQLEAWLGAPVATGTPTPPPTGDGMITIEITKALQGLNARSAPDASQANVVMGIQTNDVLICDERKIGKSQTGGALEFTKVRAIYRAGAMLNLPAGDIWVAATTVYQQLLKSFSVVSGSSVDLSTLSVNGSLTLSDGTNQVTYSGLLSKS